jgi:hypothetical protein
MDYTNCVLHLGTTTEVGTVFYVAPELCRSGGEHQRQQLEHPNKVDVYR